MIFISKHFIFVIERWIFLRNIQTFHTAMFWEKVKTAPTFSIINFKNCSHMNRPWKWLFFNVETSESKQRRDKCHPQNWHFFWHVCKKWGKKGLYCNVSSHAYPFHERILSKSQCCRFYIRGNPFFFLTFYSFGHYFCTLCIFLTLGRHFIYQELAQKSGGSSHSFFIHISTQCCDYVMPSYFGALFRYCETHKFTHPS